MRGDVLFSKDGTVGKVSLVNFDKDFVVLSSLAIIRPKSEILYSNYVKYLLQSPSFLREALGKKTGVAIRRIILNNLKKIPVSFPESLPEQKRIVAILDKAFTAIEKAKQNAEKNLQNAKELFDSYLENLDAKKESLETLIDIKTGKLDANAATEHGKYPFFTCSRDVFAIDTYAFDGEAILLAGNNAVGDFNVKHYKGKFNAYQRTYVITVNTEEKILYRYLYFQMLKALKVFNEKSVGAGTKFLKIGMIKDLKIALPSLQEQQVIVSKLDALSSQSKQLESIYQQKLNHLAELKQSLLQKAFRGEL